jgi:hypothetical protein
MITPCDKNGHIMVIWVRVLGMVETHLPTAEAGERVVSIHRDVQISLKHTNWSY